MRLSCFTCIILPLLLTCSSCEENLLREEYGNTPEDVYSAFWSEYNEAYGAFVAKNINWDSLYTAFGSDITEKSNSKELFIALCGLLDALNDGHADLYAPNNGYFRSWNRRDKSYFEDINTRDLSTVGKIQQVIRSEFLDDNYSSIQASGWMFFYGTILTEEGNIGYICIPTFSIDDFPKAFIQEAADAFINANGIIIDLRFNGGGTTEAFVYAMNCFTSEKKMFMQSKLRNGPEHDDFTELYEHRTHPHSDQLKGIPIAILMNSYTASSSEHFILGLKSQHKVFTVGDTSCGAFSSVNERLLPNGWKYRLGAQVVYDVYGDLLTNSQGKYLEGIGIAPDYYVRDHYAQCLRGNDLVLNKAIEVIGFGE